MRLHKIKRLDGKTRMYCGAAVLCSLTGEPYEKVRAMVNKVRNRRHNVPIKGMWPSELRTTLSLYGIDTINCSRMEMIKKHKGKKPTLRKFLASRSRELHDKTLLIELTEHYVTVQGQMLIDNHTIHPVWIGSAPHQRKIVQEYWVVEQEEI